MRNLLSILVGGTLLALAPAAQAADTARGEAQLARALEGRVAGEPVDCVSLSRVRSSRIIDRTAIIYDAGGVLYVNRPESGAEALDRSDTLVTKSHSNQLCSIDVVHLYDSGARMPQGVVFLGDFVPYKRIKGAHRH